MIFMRKNIIVDGLTLICKIFLVKYNLTDIDLKKNWAFNLLQGVIEKLSSYYIMLLREKNMSYIFLLHTLL